MVLKTELILDTWSLIEYFLGTPAGAKVRKILEGQSSDPAISSISVAELYKWSLRTGSVEEANENLLFVLDRCEVVPVDTTIAREAGKISAERGCGLADALIYATARLTGRQIMTGDPHFKNGKDVVYIGD
jgi:predicted nucleic acid-binding protein